MAIVNWTYGRIDFIFFGESVLITNNFDFLIIHYETIKKLIETIYRVGSAD